MGAAEPGRNLISPAWRRWFLLSVFAVLGAGYVGAYAIFSTRSRNFISVQRDAAAAAFSGQHSVELPATFEFGSDAPDNERLGGGWHMPDPTGVWSLLPRACVDLAVREADHDMEMRLDTEAFVAGQHPHTSITLTINDHSAGSWLRESSNAAEPLRVRVPAMWVHHGRLVVCLQTDPPASPFRLHAGPDRRLLGVRLKSIELR